MKSKTSLTAPPNAGAILCFLDGQYLLKWRDEERGETSKFLTSASVASAFTGQPIDSGWLPQGVNRWGKGPKGTWMLRWHPPAKYTFQVEHKDRLRNLRIPMPALVWFGQKNHYYIWAMKGLRFDPKGLLYHAPIPNIDSVGLICFGQNTKPSVEEGFDQSWKLFWEAPFNDHHVKGKSQKFAMDIRLQLFALARGKATSYPGGDLVKGHWALDAAVQKLTQRGREETEVREFTEVDDDEE